VAIERNSLNPKQLRFVEEYLVDLNGTDAAIRAGYNAGKAKKSAGIAAVRLLADRRISTEIARRQAKMSAKFEVTRERIVAELAKIGFWNIDDIVSKTSAGDPFIDLSKADRDVMAGVTEITVDDYVDGRGEDARAVKRIKIKGGNKHGALVDLGKHLGMFTKDNPPPGEAPDVPTERVVIDGGLPNVDGNEDD